MTISQIVKEALEEFELSCGVIQEGTRKYEKVEEIQVRMIYLAKRIIEGEIEDIKKLSISSSDTAQMNKSVLDFSSALLEDFKRERIAYLTSQLKELDK
jgi:hypothetical protein